MNRKRQGGVLIFCGQVGDVDGLQGPQKSVLILTVQLSTRYSLLDSRAHPERSFKVQTPRASLTPFRIMRAWSANTTSLTRPSEFGDEIDDEDDDAPEERSLEVAS
mmetsp:Transcript_76241/g.149346  ORF Transcript_76241/g.149346 Transcript_76241/m.149346 type:complete len:106 (-) Transcript_76241:1258-1575(-)